MPKEEFLALLYCYEDQPVSKIDRCSAEFLKCLQHARESGRQIKPLSEDTIVIDFDAGALSLSSTQFIDFFGRCPSFADDNIGEPKTRLAAPKGNDLSVAMPFSIGEPALLLGADLEAVGDPDRGWQAAIRLLGLRKHPAHIHEIPHRGSFGAHFGRVWQIHLIQYPWSVDTPWVHGGKRLPGPADEARIRMPLSAAYLASTKQISLSGNFDRETLKHITRSGLDFRKAVSSGGFVTFRWKPPERKARRRAAQWG